VDDNATRDGYLWFTTIDGLVRFDGVRFTTFDRSNTKAITSNRFTCLFEDGEGTLWAGTEYGGLIRYRQGEFSALTTSHGLPSNHIEEIRRSQSGGIDVSTPNGYGLVRDGKFTRGVDSLSRKEEKTFLASNGFRWRIANDDVLHVAKAKVTGQLTRFYRSHSFTTGLLAEKGELLFEDRQGTLWGSCSPSQMFSVKNGVPKFYGSAEGFIPFRPGPTDKAPGTLTIAAEDHDGTLWFGTGGGVLCFREGRFTRYTTKDGLADNEVYDLTVDREGVVWIGTPRGLTRVTKQAITTLSTDKLPYSTVYPILQDRSGDIWIGTYALTRYAQGKVTNFSFTENGDLQHLQALYEDTDGVLWVGGKTKTWRFSNGRKEKFSNENFRAVNPSAYAPTCYAFYRDHANNLWFCTNQGLFKLTDGKMTAYTMADGLPGNEIRVVHEDREGNVWFGVSGGLAKWQGGKFVSYEGEEKFKDEHVLAIHEDQEGTLWIGTYDNGLRRLKQGKFTNYKIENGLFNNEVFQIIEDAQENFWISSNKGIYRVNKRQLDDFADGKIDRITSVSYGVSDGMRNIECNAGRSPAGIKTRDGKLWFPTQDGVAIVDPSAIPVNLLPPPIVIEHVIVNRQTMPLQSKIALQPGQENLEIAYTGLSFIKPEQLNFKYKLEGWDNDWIDAGTRRSAFYSHLSQGNYQFKVKAVNSDGVWSEATADLSIKVIPPFYRTWWFISLLTLLLGGFGYLLYWYRIHQLRKVHATREAFSKQLLTVQEGFAQQLIQSQESERQRIAAELHDGLGQNLLVIKNRMLLIAAASHETKVKAQFSEIDTMVASTLTEIHTISQHLRPPHLTLLGLTSTLEEMLEQLAASTDLQIEHQIIALDGLFEDEEELNIFRICQECLNNVIKHAQASQLVFTMVRETEIIRLIIQDNGKGFDPDAVSKTSPRGSGWLSIKERLRMLRGTYRIDSALGEGTTIDVQIPILERK
jgi:signal transduction histidine kinase/ligand-binding sensor domain-containing protein